MPSDTTLTDPAAWDALAARDARFDAGSSWASPPPHLLPPGVPGEDAAARELPCFYASAARAAQAGFRPCLRCRPELAPGLSLVDSPAVLARHAARQLEHAVQAGEDIALPAVAARLGITERHLRRVFAEEHGVSPIDYLTTQRLLQAKQLLTDTALPVREVALACGFGSLRRFQSVFAERCRLSPSQLRRAGRDDPAEAAAGAPIEVRLGYRPPYDIDSMMAFWAQRAIAGVEQVDGRRLRRSFHPGPGPAPADGGWLELEFLPARHELRVRTGAGSARHWGRVLAAVRHAFDLDADPEAVAPVLDAVRVHQPQNPMQPGLRVPGSFDGFETAVRVVLGQQVSVAAARTLSARVVERFGRPCSTPFAGLTHHFPDAATLAAAAPEALGTLGIVRQRVGALQALARAVCAGLPLHRGAPLAPTLAALHALPGIGPWTVELLALRCLGWPDAFPATDIAVLKALGHARAADGPAALAQAEAWRPWRSYATIALWRGLEAPATLPCPPLPEPTP